MLLRFSPSLLVNRDDIDIVYVYTHSEKFLVNVCVRGKPGGYDTGPFDTKEAAEEEVKRIHELWWMHEDGKVDSHTPSRPR